MTVSSNLNRKEYTGDNTTTSFATNPVVFFDSGDLEVYAVVTATNAATLLVENTDYTVSGGSGSTGTVNLAGGSSPYGAPADTETLVIVRTLDLLQETDLVNNDSSDAEAVETALDRGTMMLQQLSATLSRAFRFADSDVSGASLVVPTPVASSLIGWASDGLSLANYELTDLNIAAVPAYALDIITAADDDAFFATMVDGMTAESTLATGDLLSFVDVSLTPDDGRKCTVQELWNSLNVLTAETAPAIGDYVALYDADGSAADKITLANLLKVVNSLTEDTTPAKIADYALTYDADAAAVKKVLLSALGGNVIGTALTASSSTTFSGLPAGITEFTFSCQGVSLSGTDDLLLQVSVASAFVTTDYTSTHIITVPSASNSGNTTSTAGAIVDVGNGSLTVDCTFRGVLIDPVADTWAIEVSGKYSSGNLFYGYSTIDLAGDLDGVRLFKTGTDTFDAGTVNLSYRR